MRRWETPQITIVSGAYLIDMDILVTLKQGYQKVEIVPELGEDGKTLTFKLTQEQTGMLGEGQVAMQVNAVSPNGDRIASNVVYFMMGENLHDEVMDYET